VFKSCARQTIRMRLCGQSLSARPTTRTNHSPSQQVVSRKCMQWQ
jgi:hypothetical protein